MSENISRFELGDSICSLINKSREGSDDARDDLLSQLRSYVALVAAKKMNPTFQAKFGESDVVQQSMTIVIEKFDQFRGQSEGELFAWVKQILKSQLLGNQRALRADKRDLFRERSIDRDGDSNEQHNDLAIFDRQFTPGTETLRREGWEELRDAMARLSDEYRQVIELRNWEQLAFPEIGKRMNRSANAVTKLWYRALIELKKQLGTPGQEESNG